MTESRSTISIGALFDGRYKLLRPLSSDGGTADVWLALDTNTIDEIFDETTDNLVSAEDTGIKVAIKIYRPKNALDLGEQRFREEFKIVFNCHHTNLVHPINFSIYEGTPYLVLPYCRNGSSESLQGKITDSDELWRYIGDVASGLAYLHSFNPTIVHHDIKPANILIDDNHNYAITDFGISSHRGLNREGYSESNSGTMAYMAPERFLDNYESMPESDIWSFGATLYELITGKVPFGENGGLHQLENNLDCPSVAQSVPADIKRLMADCLSRDPSKRPSAAKIIKAAHARQYPVKKKPMALIIAAAVACGLIAGLALIFVNRQGGGGTDAPTMSNEEAFSVALKLVESPDAASLKKGLIMLDSLGNLGYVPALYQQAYTYGWYSDSASLARKRLLNIEYYPDGTDEAWLPKSQRINSKAIGLFSRIEELNNPDFPEINANALYRLACYYVNENIVLKKDIQRAAALLINARQWAELSGDDRLLRRIDAGLEDLEFEYSND